MSMEKTNPELQNWDKQKYLYEINRHFIAAMIKEIFDTSVPNKVELEPPKIDELYDKMIFWFARICISPPVFTDMKMKDMAKKSLIEAHRAMVVNDEKEIEKIVGEFAIEIRNLIFTEDMDCIDVRIDDVDEYFFNLSRLRRAI